MNTIQISRLIPCALDTAQFRVVLRDLAKAINYRSPAGDIASLPNPEQLSLSRHWIGLPEWIEAAELTRLDDEAKLTLTIASDTQKEAIEGWSAGLVGELTEYFSHPLKPARTKVFCVGWEKTGTTSLTAAMRRLGYFSWQFAPWTIGLAKVLGEIPNAPPDLDALAEYDFLSNVPVYTLYREFDRRYPGSLFILTTRPVDAWLPSALMEARKGVEQQGGALPSITRWLYETTAIDEASLRGRYLRHETEVLDYFAGRPGFLAIDLSEGDPWPKLCGFLDAPIPDIPFPWLNKRTVL